MAASIYSLHTGLLHLSILHITATIQHRWVQIMRNSCSNHACMSASRMHQASAKQCSLSDPADKKPTLSLCLTGMLELAFIKSS